MTFYRANLYKLAKSYMDQGEDIYITSRSTKAEIVDALIEYFENKNLPKEKPEMSVRVQRIWEANQNQEK